MTDSLLVAASPVFEIDGERKGEFARDLVRLVVEEDNGGLRTLEARFVAFGPGGGEEEELLYLDGTIDFGSKLEVSVGGSGEMESIFSGRVSALEASFAEETEPEVCVLAEDRLMELRWTRRSKSYEQMTDADIAAEIANEHGLSSDVDAEGPTYDVVQQWNMSDLAFLRERARLVQAEIWVADDTLHFKTREKRSASELTLVRGNELITLTARADLAHQRTAIRVSGYDASQRAVVDEEAGSDAIQSEVSNGRSGPAVLENAFGERVSHRVREVPLSDSEAADWARAEMQRRSRGFVQVSGVTSGTPSLTVGSRLTLERVGGPFDGSGYYVTSVCHTFDLDQGHRTRFEAQRACVEENR